MVQRVDGIAAGPKRLKLPDSERNWLARVGKGLARPAIGPRRLFGRVISADHHLDDLVCDVDQLYLYMAALATLSHYQSVHRNSPHGIVTVDVHDMHQKSQPAAAEKYATHCVWEVQRERESTNALSP
jgi:hypothetical protein